MTKVLKTTFLIDGIIAVGFGIFSWLYPLKTFGSIISIPNENLSLFLSLLSSLSLFYLLIGITCLIGIKSNHPIAFWIAIVMLIRHLLEGLIKVADVGKSWLIGNPYQDIAIHSIFIITYLIGIILLYKNNKS